MSAQAFISLAVAFLFSLTLILFIFLPVFQIKFELERETVAAKNFSLWENYKNVKNHYNKNINHFTDISSTALLIYLIIMAGTAILTCVGSFLREFRPADAEERAKKIFIEAKTDSYKYLERERIYGILFLGVCALIVTAIQSKNAEYKITSSIPFTVTEIDNYLYYSFEDSSLTCKVFLNFFKFCNGVSEYLAIPIITFSFACILYGFWIYSKKQLKKEIQAEKIEGSEEPATAENDTTK